MISLRPPHNPSSAPLQAQPGLTTLRYATTKAQQIFENFMNSSLPARVRLWRARMPLRWERGGFVALTLPGQVYPISGVRFLSSFRNG